MKLNIPPRYRRDLENATSLFKNAGCQSVFLFGSLATGQYHEKSDIDIGVKGLPDGKFLPTCAKVYLTVDNDIDIVDFDSNQDFYSLLDRLGEVVEVG